MQTQLNYLKEFNEAFGIHYRTEFKERQPLMTIEQRYRLMKEELDEWMEDVMNAAPKANRAKELADLLFTVFGTILAEGLQDDIERVFAEVHLSNMSKLQPDGSVLLNPAGKVMKGINYREADLSFLNSEPCTHHTT